MIQKRFVEEVALVLVCNFEEVSRFCQLHIEAVRINSCQTEGTG